MKRRLLGLLAIGLLHLPASCFVDGTNCGVGLQSARYTTLTAELGSFFNDRYSTWGGFLSRSWEIAVIAVIPEGIEYLSASRNDGINFSLSGTAYACDPAPPDFPMINDLAIIADSGFLFQSDTVSQGDTVNHLFHAISIRDIIDIEEFINNHNEQYPIFGYDLDLLLSLTESPGDTLESSFTVNIEFDDGTSLSTQTPVLHVH